MEDIELPLIFKAKCLGKESHSIAIRGAAYDIFKLNGRGQAVGVGSLNESVRFMFQGSLSNGTIRLCSDKDLALEVNERKFESGTFLSLWSQKGNPEFSVRFCLNDDMTITPLWKARSTDKQNLVIGADKNRLKLVRKSNSEQCCVFEGFEEIKRQIAEAAALKDEIQMEKVKEILTDKILTDLKKDGFVKIPNLVDKELIHLARREVNRELGSKEHPVGKFKAKIFPSIPIIVDSFNKTILPYLLQKLLGDDHPLTLTRCQIALRFPGDFCGKGEARSQKNFDHVAKGWHIDGIPMDFIRGVTDHYGTIHNFDALVGILLADVEETMSGELCCYPGSHLELAEYFKKDDRLKKLKNDGKLPDGDKTKKVFKKEPVNCLGKAGDVFLANYMTAHFIAPNDSPDIRYALYFRVTGTALNGKSVNGHCPDSMLKPWLHWPVMNDIEI